MKRTGMKRSLDRLGRIVLPKELRDTMGIHIGDPLEFFTEGKELILRKYKSTLCVFCGDMDTDMYFKEQFICRTCALDLKLQDDIPQEFVPQIIKTPTSPERIIPDSKQDTSNEFNEKATKDYPNLRPKTAIKLKQLKEIIEQQPDLSQQQIADKLGISQGRISQLKRLLINGN
ncbi:transcriptional pleiotropic regulator of transition state genes [Paenibacillus sp. CF095]|uniref:AbrB/MazE/SpoVT family DNA-binding domain-containing protein n=1 Tax=Paenibacillus sp. CF095 TaxID=1881033 RepID=UPI00088476EA|nr:AbrB/MazE/SpoVT family DNA-binding domain-containing protein [Paenibacillus sp. CF095]SDD52502.1 transcriptional pleiotropic regulator of transition state genes [Paenibacillus sp. CF095]